MSPAIVRLAPRLGFFFALGLVALIPGAAHAAAGSASIAKANRIVEQFCKSHLAAFKAALALAKSKTKPEIPVPPQLWPDCTVCGSGLGNKVGANEKAINAWAARVMEPEAPEYVRNALEVARFLQIAGNGVIPDEGDLTPANASCLKTFGSSEDAVDTATRLVDRVYDGKVLPMARKYRKDRTRAYAGIVVLLRTSREYALLHGGEANEDPAMTYAADWVSAVGDNLDKDIFNGHLYNLCPSYATVFRQIALLGLPSIDVEHLLDGAKKIDKFLNFKVTMDLHDVSNGADGAHTDIHWIGTTNLHLKVDFGKGCYTPELADPNLAVTTDHFEMRNKNRQIRLIGPKDFKAPINFVGLTLCDPNPQFRVTFADFGPPSQLSDDPEPAPLFQGMMLAAIGEDLKTSGESEGAHQRGMDLAAEAKKHQNDPAWWQSPEGKAMLEKLQGVASGIQVPAAQTNSGAAMQMISLPVTVKWTNGTTTVVDQTLKAIKNSTDDELHVTVEQVPQQ